MLGSLRRKYASFIPKLREFFDEDGVSLTRLDEDGREVLEGTPVDPPVGHQPLPSMHQLMRELIQSEALKKQMEEAGEETFEESEDFDTGEFDDDPQTEWEQEFDPELVDAKEALIDAINNPSPGQGDSVTEQPQAVKSAEPQSTSS